MFLHIGTKAHKCCIGCEFNALMSSKFVTGLSHVCRSSLPSNLLVHNCFSLDVWNAEIQLNVRASLFIDFSIRISSVNVNLLCRYQYMLLHILLWLMRQTSSNMLKCLYRISFLLLVVVVQLFTWLLFFGDYLFIWYLAPFPTMTVIILVSNALNAPYTHSTSASHSDVTSVEE